MHAPLGRVINRVGLALALAAVLTFSWSRLTVVDAPESQAADRAAPVKLASSVFDAITSTVKMK